MNRTRYIPPSGGRRPHALLLGIPLFPGDSHQSSLYEYYITLSRQPMVNGYSPVVSREIQGYGFLAFDQSQPRGDPGKGVCLAPKFGVTHLVHHQEIYNYKVSPFTGYLAFKNLAASPYLQLVWTDKTQSFFAVLPDFRSPPGRRAGTGMTGDRVCGRRVGPRGRRPVTTDPEGFKGKSMKAEGQGETGGLLAQTGRQFFPTGRYRAVFRVNAAPIRGPRKPSGWKFPPDSRRRSGFPSPSVLLILRGPSGIPADPAGI